MSSWEEFENFQFSIWLHKIVEIYLIDDQFISYFKCSIFKHRFNTENFIYIIKYKIS